MANRHPADAQYFIKHMADGGYRPNRYRVTFVGDLKGIDKTLSKKAQEQMSVFCVASALPQSTMGIAEAQYFGRAIKMAGDKTFDDWTCEMYTDSDFTVRTFMENWHDSILGFETNFAAQDYRKPLTYYLDAFLEIYTREGEVINTYEMKQIFPSSVGELSLSYENNNQIARFPVTFAINYFTPVNKNASFQSLSRGLSN